MMETKTDVCKNLVGDQVQLVNHMEQHAVAVHDVRVVMLCDHTHDSASNRISPCGVDDIHLGKIREILVASTSKPPSSATLELTTRN